LKKQYRAYVGPVSVDAAFQSEVSAAVDEIEVVDMAEEYLMNVACEIPRAGG
jgi:hypothetical protein